MKHREYFLAAAEAAGKFIIINREAKDYEYSYNRIKVLTLSKDTYKVSIGGWTGEVIDEDYIYASSYHVYGVLTLKIEKNSTSWKNSSLSEDTIIVLDFRD